MSVGLSVTAASLAATNKTVNDWFAAVKDAARDAAVGLAKEVLDNALINSPQFSGDYTASWRVSPKVVDYTFNNDAIPGAARWGQHGDVPEPFGRGDPEAIEYAERHNAYVWGMISFGDTIYISNSSQHAEAYVWKIENNQIRFRRPNMGAYRVGQNAIEKIARRHPKITKTQLESWKALGT